MEILGDWRFQGMEISGDGDLGDGDFGGLDKVTPGVWQIFQPSSPESPGSHWIC